MAERLTPAEIRDRSFAASRRGYDRGEVDAFKSEIATLVEDLEMRVAAVGDTLDQLGLSELPDLKGELESVAGDVGRVLSEAREAAALMRSRAADDAARWRAEADAEATAVREGATRDAQKARGDAWDTASEMLSQAEEASSRLLADAQKDALFIRAESEREALRQTGDARRDAEELLREARSEAERLHMAARAESETILVRARQSAEAAQERARALEQRRAELMGELESARHSIGQLESEIDSRREALHAVATSSDSTIRVIEPGAESSWADGDPSVRVVPASRVRIDEPVDADALVAEVEELRARSAEPAPGSDPSEPEVEVAEPPVAEVASQEAPPEEEEAAGEPGPAEPEAEPVQDQAADASEPPGEQAEEVPEVPAVPEPVAGAPEGIGDLFASLRSAGPEVAPEPRAPEPAADESEDVATANQTEAPEPAPSTTAVPAAAVDPFEARDRHLLPITNRGLRSVKRDIIELQNRVLEELRVSKTDWAPENSMFGAAMGDEVGRLVREAFVSGHAAAAELTGTSETPQPRGTASVGKPTELAEALAASVAAAFERASAGSGGARKLSAAVSKVFRSWRTDEAERRLRHTARSAFQEGLVAGYATLGVGAVMAVAPGRPCGSCAASTGVTWAPGSAPSGDVVIPPAGVACDAMVIPAAPDAPAGV